MASIGNNRTQNHFAQRPSIHTNTSLFDRSQRVLDTYYFNTLWPCYVEEIIPGDTMTLSVQAFMRLATQKVPIMDNTYAKFAFFFVPSRLVWSNFEKFWGSQKNPGDSTAFLVPQVSNPAPGYPVMSNFDKMGIPTGVPNTTVNALPFRGMNLIYNEWFRDQNTQNSLPVPLDDGPDAPATYDLMTVNKVHDYFTSALPWPQKGADVLFPSGTNPVTSNNTVPQFRRGDTTDRNMYLDSVGGRNTFTADGGAVTTGTVVFGANTGLQVSLANAGNTINNLRAAFAVQNYLETNARGGTRYVEMLLSRFNVVSPDFRLQRPEYLGGGKVQFNTHPVAQTAPGSGNDQQATLSAFSTASVRPGEIGFSHSFVEHGYVIGLVWFTADITYQQGLNKMWSRRAVTEFFMPEFEGLGEQIITNDEIYMQGTAADKLPFAYQERFADYKYKPSEIRGEFRSTFALSLDIWHLAQRFLSLPTFSSAFLKVDTPIARALSVTNQSQVLADLCFKLKHARPMKTYSTPATLRF